MPAAEAALLILVGGSLAIIMRQISIYTNQQILSNGKSKKDLANIC